MRYRHIFGQVATVEWAIAGAAGFVILALLGFAVWHYREGRGHAPSRTAHATRIELSYWAFLVVFAVGFYVWTISRNATERTFSGRLEVTVNVVGFRWCWQFTYPHARVVSTGTCIGSVPRNDQRARSTQPLLELPADRTIRFNLSSKDVIHGFWLPYMDYKMYVYPNHVNSFEARFTKTGDHPGRCAVFCGLYHFRMDFRAHLVPPATFRAWLATQQRHGGVLDASTSSVAPRGRTS